MKCFGSFAPLDIIGGLRIGNMDIRRLEAFEIWPGMAQRMQRVNWMECRTNEKILHGE